MIQSPKTGEGVHYWLPSAARKMRGAGASESEIFDVLRGAVAHCGRVVPDIEIRNAINLVFNTESTPRASQGRYSMPLNYSETYTRAYRTDTSAYRTYTRPKIPKMAINRKLHMSITSNGHGIDDLIGLSPIFTEHGETQKPEDYLSELFREDEYLCVAKNGPQTAKTQIFSDWKGSLADCAFIVPSPMTSQTGKNKEGKQTARCLDNTGKRRHLVIESDTNSPDEQASVLLHLDKFAPLVMAVSSGSKSIHGWYYVEGMESKVRAFMAYAQTLGADPATLLKCQLVRMPAGTRENGAAQTVLYFNPLNIRKLYDRK